MPPAPSPAACLWGMGRGGGAVPKISLSPVAQSPSLAHSPAGLAAQTLPKPHPEAMRSPGRQHRTPAVLSEVTSEAPQTPAAWGPASPNLTTHPSRTLPGDGTPRPQIVSWAAGMPRSYEGRASAAPCTHHGAGTATSPRGSGEAPGFRGHEVPGRGNRSLAPQAPPGLLVRSTG